MMQIKQQYTSWPPRILPLIHVTVLLIKTSVSFWFVKISNTKYSLTENKRSSSGELQNDDIHTNLLL